MAGKMARLLVGSREMQREHSMADLWAGKKAGSTEYLKEPSQVGSTAAPKKVWRAGTMALGLLGTIENKTENSMAVLCAGD